MHIPQWDWTQGSVLGPSIGQWIIVSLLLWDTQIMPGPSKLAPLTIDRTLIKMESGSGV